MREVAADLERRRAAEANRHNDAKQLSFASRLAHVPQRRELTPEEKAKRDAEAVAERDRRAAMERHARRNALAGQMGRRYAHASLDTFHAIDGNQQARKAEAADYAENVAERIKAGVGLLLIGPPGTGKDHLAAAVMFAACDAGFNVRWVNGVGLFAGARDAIRDDASERAWAEQFIKPDLLAISDPVPPAGAVRDGWQLAKLFEIIDGRYRDMRPTILTVNVADRAEAVARMSENIVQRLEDGSLVLKCNWPSYRKPLA